MTLEGMNEYLKDKGFDVRLDRDSKRDLYIFTISKPGYKALTKEFKYPKSDDWNYRKRQMEKFLDQMLRDFYKLELTSAHEENGKEDTGYIVSYVDYPASQTPRFGHLPEITNVIFNNPATIVFWADGTKTVVKCQKGYEFDPMVGLSMAICEKAFGSKAASHKIFNEWLPREENANISSDRALTLREMKTSIGEMVAKCQNFLEEMSK